MFTSVPLDTDEARQKTMIKIKFASSIDPSVPSIWSSDYPSDSLVSLKHAADTFPDGGRPGFVAWMKDRCSITQTESLQHHLGVDDVWRKLTAGFIMLAPILYYEPILRAFVRQLLLTLVEDGVRWVEVRAVLISPITLSGKDLPEENGSMALATILNECFEQFKASEEGKDFWGARIIWTSMRHRDTAFLIEGLFPLPNLLCSTQCIYARRRYESMHRSEKSLPTLNRRLRLRRPRRPRTNPPRPHARTDFLPLPVHSA